MIKENAESTHRNTLIIIGNGFDLAHKMPFFEYYEGKLSTSYRDFIIARVLEDIKFHKLSENYQDTYLRCLKFGRTKGDIREELTSLCFSLKSELALDIEKYPYKILNNFFYHIFSKQGLNGWVDIECEYFNMMTSLFETGGDIIKLNAEFSLIIKGLESHLNNIEVNVKRECEKKEKIQLHIDSIFKKYMGKVHILNFNYTSTPELYLNKEDESRFTLNYIHGKLFDNNNPIIFGYGNEAHPKYKQIEDSGNKEYLRFLKSYAYLQTNNYHNFLKFIESDNFDVIIMGHSCGMSDGVMLKTIFEHSNCQNIIIKYYEYMNSDGKIINDFFSKTQEIARHFSDKAMFRKKVLPISNPAVTPLVPLLG